MRTSDYACFGILPVLQRPFRCAFLLPPNRTFRTPEKTFGDFHTYIFISHLLKTGFPYSAHAGRIRLFFQYGQTTEDQKNPHGKEPEA
jgi:hypothetical protein